MQGDQTASGETAQVLVRDRSGSLDPVAAQQLAMGSAAQRGAFRIGGRRG